MIVNATGVKKIAIPNRPEIRKSNMYSFLKNTWPVRILSTYYKHSQLQWELPDFNPSGENK